MNATSPAILHLARQLLAADPARVQSQSIDQDKGMRASEKLRLPLIRLAGTTGFASLLSRALALAKRQSPVLAGLRVEADGSLSGFDTIKQDANAAELLREGETILLAELLGLLVALIGEPLTLGLVGEAWPGVTIAAVSLRTEDKS